MLFDTILLESGGRLRTQQRWTALLSAAVQMAAFTAVVVLSMAYTETLPAHMLREIITVPPVPPSAPSPEANRQQRATATTVQSSGPIREPASIPNTTPRITDDLRPPGAVGNEIGVLNSAGPSGPSNPMLRDVLRPRQAVVAAPPRATVVHLSQPQPGALIVRVEPRYPPLAIATRTSGTVLLHATISPEGRIVGLEVVSGTPLLVRAAVEAVQQWRYRPYLLNGQAVAVETQITVNFVLEQ